MQTKKESRPKPKETAFSFLIKPIGFYCKMII